MKKLMIAAAVAVVGIAANAAAISWASTDAVYCTKDSNGTVGTTKATAATGQHNVALYIYEIAAEDFATVSAMDVATLYDTYYNTESYSAKGATTGTGKVTATQTVDNESGMHYAVALFIDETNAGLLPDGAERWVKAAVVATPEPGVTGSGTVTAPNLWSSANAKAANWTAVPVPEPTSGLLLLLGVAGMALRRRRA